MQMRWHWPPENWCGRRSDTTVGVEPDGLEHLVDLGRRRPCPCPRSTGPRRRCRATLRRGFSDEMGSWKIICSRVRTPAQILARELGEVDALEADVARRGRGAAA